MKSKIILIIILIFVGAVNLEAIEIHHFKIEINLAFPDNEGNSLGTQDQYRPYLDNAILILPDSYDAASSPTRLVYCAHGAGGGVDSAEWFLQHFSIIDSLLNNGYAVFDVNGGPSLENMGGSWVTQSALKAYGYILENFNVHDEIFVIGLSMGGLSSSNFVRRHPAKVIAQAFLSPVLDLKSQAWDHPWFPSTRVSIAKAYNFDNQSGDHWESNKVKGWNPIETHSIESHHQLHNFYPVPIKIWHGQTDTVVPAEISMKFHQYIIQSGGSSELRLLDSDDHGLSVGNPEINHELILFFRQFDY